jgi:hypothetical protein
VPGASSPLLSSLTPSPAGAVGALVSVFISNARRACGGDLQRRDRKVAPIVHAAHMSTKPGVSPHSADSVGPATLAAAYLSWALPSSPWNVSSLGKLLLSSS